MKKEDEVVKQLKWRLSERPTVESIEKLITLGVITKEDARKLLLDEDEMKPKSLKDLQNEIALLRELVLDMAKREPKPIVKIIERFYDTYWYKQPYRIEPWAKPYEILCLSSSNNITSGSTLSMAINATSSDGSKPNI